MATNDSLKNQLTQKKSASSALVGFKSLANNESVKKKFEEVLGKRASQFMASMINMYSNEESLQVIKDQHSILSACMVAATLDLPVDRNLGYAWVVPYNGKGTFQIGYKGLIQLALRTGQYKAMNAIVIHEGELLSWNPLTEALTIDFKQKNSDAVIGYAGYFELMNGYKKTVYWSIEQMAKHKARFSKSDYIWKQDYDAMALKTVIRNMLSKWGILSIEMQQGVSVDLAQEEGRRVEVNTDDGQAIFDITSDAEIIEQEETLD